MSSKTSSRSTFTTVPSTMSPSLKYLMVSSIAARNASSDPMSLTATLGVEVACVLVMCGLAPDADREKLWARRKTVHPKNDQDSQDLPEPARADHGTPGGRQSGHVTSHHAAQTGTHEDTAQRSEYESKPPGSIDAGHNTATVLSLAVFSGPHRPGCGRCRPRRRAAPAARPRPPSRCRPARGRPRARRVRPRGSARRGSAAAFGRAARTGPA